ncbi:MAG: ABC transporter permease [Deltaproteobacteria bacterium]|jgi:NitT/TauT family transport system permease protein|nr:ABC transporter permease [Deltaproteobacteria bacterium]
MESIGQPLTRVSAPFNPAKVVRQAALAIQAFGKRYVSILAFLLIWETLSRLQKINPIFFPPFTDILGTILRLFEIGVMGEHVRVSLQRAIPGVLLAALVGVPLGLILGTFFSRVKTFLEIPLEVLSQINPFLLFHILILFMGIGESPKITIIFWTCLWPITLNTMHGGASVNSTPIKAGRAFGLDRTGLIKKIVVPATMSHIFTGLRLSLGYSMFMLVAAEMMGASSGLGWLVLASQGTFQLNRMFAAVMVIALLGLILDALIYSIGHRYLTISLEGFSNSAES